MRDKFQLHTNTYLIIGSGLLIVAFMLMLWFLLKGEKKVVGAWDVDEKKESLVCNVSNLKYPLYELDESDSNELKVNIVFNHDAKDIESISLMYIQYLDNEKQKVDSLNTNNGAMSMAFGKDKIAARDYDLKFSKFSDGLQMSIFLSNGSFEKKSAKYFMLDNVWNYDIKSVRQAYEKQGFKCANN